MGYYTRFDLKITRDTTPSDSEIIAAFRAVSDSASYALGSDGSSVGSTKWYDHQADLEAFSTSYPTVLFTLNGNGEESGDIWALYVRNGKTEKVRASLAIPPPTI